MQGKTDFKRGKRLCCGRSILDPHIPGPYVMHSRMLSKFPSPNLRHNSTTDAQSSSHPMSSSLVCKPRKWTRNSSRLTAQQRTKSPSSSHVVEFFLSAICNHSQLFTLDYRKNHFQQSVNDFLHISSFHHLPLFSTTISVTIPSDMRASHRCSSLESVAHISFQKQGVAHQATPYPEVHHQHNGIFILEFFDKFYQFLSLVEVTKLEIECLFRRHPYQLYQPGYLCVVWNKVHAPVGNTPANVDIDFTKLLETVTAGSHSI